MILQVFAKASGNPEQFEEKYCGEFAYALRKFLKSNGITSKVFTGIRTSKELKYSDPLTTYSFSHVILEAFNDTWDWHGNNAMERWNERWSDIDDAIIRIEWKTNRNQDSYREKYGAEKFNKEVENLVIRGLEKAFQEVMVA